MKLQHRYFTVLVYIATQLTEHNKIADTNSDNIITCNKRIHMTIIMVLRDVFLAVLVSERPGHILPVLLADCVKVLGQ